MVKPSENELTSQEEKEEELTGWAATWNDYRRQFMRKPKAVASLIFLLLLIGAALAAPYIAPFDPDKPNVKDMMEPPGAPYYFGTDHMGRDIFSRILYGGRYSLSVGLIAVSISLLVGTTMGVIAGYAGGRVDDVIMRLVDVMLAIPGLILALVVIAILGPGLSNVMLALGVASSPVYARLSRSSVLSVKEQEFIEAARSVGASHFTIIWRHIMPNILAPLIVYTTLRTGIAILSAAGLSFIGLGAQPPKPEWGAMLAVARNYIREGWWMATFPGLAITSAVLSINILGDSLRDILDPRIQETGARQ